MYNLFLGKQDVARGAIITDPVAYTPIFVGFGTVTNVSVYSWREGAVLKVQGKFTPGAATAVTASMTLGFGGVSGNVSGIADYANTKIVGSLWRNNNDVVQVDMTVIGTANNFVYFGQRSGAGQSVLTPATGSSLVTGEVLSVNFEIPILGWSSNAVMSSDVGGRDVVFNGSSIATTAVGAIATVPFTATVDTVGGWSVDTYTVKSSGRINALANIPINSAAAGNVEIHLFKNGVQQTMTYYTIPASSVILASLNWTDNYVCGDTIQIKISSTVGVISLLGSGVSGNKATLAIAKFASPQTSMQAAPVVATYTGTPTSVANPGAVLKMPTKIVDTHGAYDTSTGVFKCSRSGYLKAGVATSIVGTGGTAATYSVFILRKNGVDIFQRYKVGDLYGTGELITDTEFPKIPVVAGDLIDIYHTPSGWGSVTGWNASATRFSLSFELE
ncbi:MAG: hypothetical protein IPL34_20435 [Thiofilum sp.]|uniref:hypothetical protein n=1 Tax=Thiofilum sp. TaxID=2212733 RepID=UPI0025DB909E|nr:hypothetical protein [Thiofilum sp.]MBK8455651.1 hypothetical protein [Thiofilum sp.]